jgi:hypothetical protein
MCGLAHPELLHRHEVDAGGVHHIDHPLADAQPERDAEVLRHRTRVADAISLRDVAPMEE